MSYFWPRCSVCNTSRPPHALTAGVCNDAWHSKLDDEAKCAEELQQELAAAAQAEAEKSKRLETATEEAA